MQRVFRETGAAGMSGVPGGDDLALINGYSKRALGGDEVYTFCILLLDNEVDRDNERFSRETILGFRELFLGKSGLFDHNWSAREQTARIFKTEVVEVPGQVTSAGDAYLCLKGWAYMLRKGNEALVMEIEAGIKKEVSVGCSVERKVCSICKKEVGDHIGCGHTKGTRYRIGGEERLCFGELVGAKDAYEWSFVAVPAQRRAGVLKGFLRRGEETLTLKEHVEKLRQSGETAPASELVTIDLLGRMYHELSEQ